MDAPTERRRFLGRLFSCLGLRCASIFALKKGLNNLPGEMITPFAGRAETMEVKGADYIEKIDIFTHIAPKNYVDSFQKYIPNAIVNQALWDLDVRFRMMDQLGNIKQILTLVSPPIENIPDRTTALELAKTANDGVAELSAKYPERFAGGTASLPMSDMDSALKELERAIRDLGLKGVQIYTSVNGEPLDSPEFMPLYEKMAGYDLPIWIHPISHENHPFYLSDHGSESNPFNR